MLLITPYISDRLTIPGLTLKNRFSPIATDIFSLPAFPVSIEDEDTEPPSLSWNCEVLIIKLPALPGLSSLLLKDDDDIFALSLFIVYLSNDFHHLRDVER